MFLKNFNAASYSMFIGCLVMVRKGNQHSNKCFFLYYDSLTQRYDILGEKFIQLHILKSLTCRNAGKTELGNYTTLLIYEHRE